jgi:hypothetical protein
MLHSIRRSFADKRLNFPLTFVARSQLSLLCTYVPDYKERILAKLHLEVPPSMQQFFKREQKKRVYHSKRKKSEEYRTSRNISKVVPVLAS